jgi:putative tryptophan/tyrosine transport system substrate-binding protein
LRRREFFTLLSGASIATPLAARAQHPAKVRRVGYLFPSSATAAASPIAAFLDGLRAIGYGEPQEVTVVSRAADGDPGRIAPLLADLIAQHVDVIVAISPAAVQAARAATTTIPIVAHDLETDPVANGLVASLAHPGGNITGFFFDFPDFSMKWLELMKEAIPRLANVAALWDPTTGPTQTKAIEEAAKFLNVNLEIIELRSLSGLDDALVSAGQRGANALLILSSPIFGLNAPQVAEIVTAHRFPAITLFPEFARAGGLMAYGPDLLDTFREVGVMTGKVLRGTKPADLPVERSTKFELVVNLRTAQTLGVTIPGQVLVRADEVIE